MFCRWERKADSLKKQSRFVGVALSGGWGDIKPWSSPLSTMWKTHNLSHESVTRGDSQHLFHPKWVVGATWVSQGNQR